MDYLVKLVDGTIFVGRYLSWDSAFDSNFCVFADVKGKQMPPVGKKAKVKVPARSIVYAIEQGR